MPAKSNALREPKINPDQNGARTLNSQSIETRQVTPLGWNAKVLNRFSVAEWVNVFPTRHQIFRFGGKAFTD